MSVQVKRPVAVGHAIAAGLLGAVLVDLFLILSHQAPFPGIYQFVASGLVGQAAFTSSSYIVLGVILHLVISIVWALLYAFVVTAMGRGKQWVLDGAIFGVIVMIAMTGLLMAKGMGAAPTTGALIGSLIAHVVFFGWPVAWYYGRK